jgi:hypothetical protein
VSALPARRAARLRPGEGMLADRSFRFFWLARAISLTGSAVTAVVLPLLMYQQTGSPVATSLLAGTEAIPYIVFGPFAGVISDRVRRRPYLVGFDLASAAAVAVVPVSWALGGLRAPVLFAAGFGAGICFVWYDAALFGAVPALVGRAGLVRANPLLQGTSTAAALAGPALGTTLAAAIGAAPVLSLDAASFAISAALIALIPKPMQEPHVTGGAGGARRVFADLAEGLRFLWHDRTIRALVAMSLALSVAGGAVFGLLVVYVTKGLGVSAHSSLIGLFYTAAALGGLGAVAWASWLGRRLGPVLAALLALAASPPLLAALAVADRVPAALGLLTAWAVTYSAVTINAITARQIRIPNRLQGRVNTTARLLGWGVGWPAGAAIAGVLAGTIGIRAAYLLAAAGLALLAGSAWLSPLRAERPPAPARPRQPAAVRNVTVPPHHGPEGGTATVDDGGKAE